MNFIRITVLVGLVVLIQGCASPTYDYLPKTVQISEPPVGSVSTAYIGDVLLTQGTTSEHDAILLEYPVKVGLVGTYTFSPGYYTKTGGGVKSGFYLPSKYSNGGSVTKGVLTDPFKIIEAKYSPQELCGVSVLNGKVCKKHSFKVTTQIASGINNFQQTLIYSGKIANKVNFGYREFSKDLARPAFNNDVEYDIAVSNIVGYKGARIEILEATNEFIKYKVLANFNTAR
jgi:hypothetical protein